MTDVRMIMSTIPSTVDNGVDIGKVIAETLVREKRVACVNQIPGLRSTYIWDGKLVNDSEELLLFKTTVEQINNGLFNRIKDLHPYDVPEIIEIKVEDGSPSFIKWVINSCKSE
jgi:periplasmic divalent cation tolerance protein